MKNNLDAISHPERSIEKKPFRERFLEKIEETKSFVKNEAEALKELVKEGLHGRLVKAVVRTTAAITIFMLVKGIAAPDRASAEEIISEEGPKIVQIAGEELEDPETLEGGPETFGVEVNQGFINQFFGPFENAITERFEEGANLTFQPEDTDDFTKGTFLEDGEPIFKYELIISDEGIPKPIFHMIEVDKTEEGGEKVTIKTETHHKPLEDTPSEETISDVTESESYGDGYELGEKQVENKIDKVRDMHSIQRDELIRTLKLNVDSKISILEKADLTEEEANKIQWEIGRVQAHIDTYENIQD